MQPRSGLTAAATIALLATAPGAAAAPAAPYVDFELLLDNSPSMEIGATPGDIAAMMYLTPCSSPGAVDAARPNLPFGMSRSGQMFNAYTCRGTNQYDGTAAPYNEPGCPIPAPYGVRGMAALLPSASVGPRCANLAPQGAALPTAGAPCAFACHFDTVDPLGAEHDYYGLARSTVGQMPCSRQGALPGSCAITLRFDLVKTAVGHLITLMRQDSLASLNNLAVGIFTFDADLQQVYPPPAICGVRASPSCQAGNDWGAAIAAVGTPPVTPNTPDTGIQPYSGGNGAATNIPRALTLLARDYLTPGGTGAALEAPLKALVLVTDGLADYSDGGTRRTGATDPALCETYKNMGYTVFVLYTPYYPLMNAFYLAIMRDAAEGTGPGSIVYNLRQCASDSTNDFIEASPTDSSSIANAMQLFLSRALNSRGAL